VNLAFEQHGGYLYAATHADYGVFALTLPPESLDRASALFGEVLTRPRFFDLDIEKGIVLEEIREDLDDDGRQIDADNLSRMLVYKEHPLGFTITGTEDTVRSFDVPLLAAHHARHYTAGSSVLVFSGAVDPSHALEIAARDFGAMPQGSPITAEAPVHAQKKPRVRIVDNQSSQTELRVAVRAVSDASPSRPALDMLLRLLDDGMSTRLYHRICDAQGLCYDVSAIYDSYEDDGILDFAAGVAHQKTARVTGEILSLLKELGQEGPTDEELAKARRRAAWEARALADSAEELGGHYGHALLFGREETPEERLAKLTGVSREEVREATRAIARPERMNVLAVGLLDRGEDRRLVDVVKGFEPLK
jgi:predicted Zn-dependent peptidase